MFQIAKSKLFNVNICLKYAGLENLENLRELNISNNEVSEMPQIIFPCLQKLDISNNNLLEFPSSSSNRMMVMMPILTHLDISSNKLTSFELVNEYQL